MLIEDNGHVVVEVDQQTISVCAVDSTHDIKMNARQAAQLIQLLHKAITKTWKPM